MNFRDWYIREWSRFRDNDLPHLRQEMATVKAQAEADRWLLRAVAMALGTALLKLVLG